MAMTIRSLRIVPRRNKKKVVKNVRMIAWLEDNDSKVTQLTSDTLPALIIKASKGERKLDVTISSSAGDDEVLLHHLLNRTRGQMIPTKKKG